MVQLTCHVTGTKELRVVMMPWKGTEDDSDDTNGRDGETSLCPPQSCLYVSSMDTGGQWLCQKKTCYWLLILSFTLEKAVVQQYKAENKTWMQSTAVDLGHSKATLANTTLSDMVKQDVASLFPKACTYPTHGKPPEAPEEHMLIPAQH